MYDAIVVGARCAGASLAMLLARKGYRALLVDRATFPSDQTMSTHLVWQNGTNRLRKWGLLDRVAASNCPPMSSFIIDFGDFVLAGEPPPLDGQRHAFAPRRYVLDKILVDAAGEAGAEIREGFFVRELQGDGDRVTGIAGSDKTGATVREAARIVIGADGMNSLVARAVQAQEYNAKPRLQGTYFTYWSDVPVDGVEFYVGDWRGAYAMPTNDGMTVVGANWTARDVRDVKADIETNYLETLETWAPPLAKRVRDGTREDRWLGGPIPNFFRKPYGPGWALVGDAGVTMDPCTAEGISNALRDADLIADALDEGLSGQRPLDEALARYEQRRNATITPIYELTCELAPFAPLPPDRRQLLEALPGNQADTDRFLGLIAQTVPIPEFFAEENVQRILSAASKVH
ncbi:MAG: NAD(P)/FAD-dependent oxidoreductase [Rhodospirillales bacterium]|nr:NAD(P)/FAD-dependent oxidoreductase [Rhodospirillales bacterium]